jgi:formate--tetrahydrofolate ligase
MSEVKSDIQIAREAKMRPINNILAKVNVPDESTAFSPMGRHIAKINLEYLDTLKNKPDGKLILVTAITPTPAGEGKTTTSVGLNDGLNKIGKIYCLFKRAKFRAFIWYERWCCWRWICPGCTNGTDKSAFHR